MLRKATALVVWMAWVSACSEAPADELSGGGPRGDGGGSSTIDEPGDGDDADGSTDGPPPSSDDGGSFTDAGDEGPRDAEPTEAAAPTCPDQGSVDLASQPKLQAWLQKRAYTCWKQESVVHASAGPHSGNVKTYLNDALHGSFEKSDAEHPMGAMAVKELYGKSKTTPFGWAVGIKTQAKSNGGKGWYWYEVFDTSPNTTNFIGGQNYSECTPCHSGGDDFVLSPFPLQ